MLKTGGSGPQVVAADGWPVLIGADGFRGPNIQIRGAESGPLSQSFEDLEGKPRAQSRVTGRNHPPRRSEEAADSNRRWDSTQSSLGSNHCRNT